MNFLPFQPPTDYYCQELASLDEEICSLLAKRKELSNQNPGFPEPDLIARWSQAFGLKEYWLCIAGAGQLEIDNSSVIPVNYHKEIHKPSLHPDIHDVDTPDLIGMDDVKVSGK